MQQACASRSESLSNGNTQVIEVCLPQLARGVLESTEEITSIHLENHTCDKRLPVSQTVIICFGKLATKMSVQTCKKRIAYIMKLDR